MRLTACGQENNYSSFDVQSWLLKRALDEYQVFVQRLWTRELRVGSIYFQDTKGAVARLC
jgi:hypothetical protein